MNRSWRTLLSFGALAAMTIVHAGTFRVTITNNGPQPLSPLFFAASDSTFNTFTLGGTASAGIKNIAERGNATAMTGIAAAAGSAVATYGVLGGSPLTPGNTRTTTFTTDSAHPYFSFAAMLGQTNDGFIGESVSSAMLNLNNGPLDLHIFGTRAWDAGTELNTQNAADLGFKGGSGNPADTNTAIRVHAGVIPGVGDSWQDMPAWTSNTDLARIQVQAVPEPATWLGLGLGALVLLRRRRR